MFMDTDKIWEQDLFNMATMPVSLVGLIYNFRDEVDFTGECCSFTENGKSRRIVSISKNSWKMLTDNSQCQTHSPGSAKKRRTTKQTS